MKESGETDRDNAESHAEKDFADGPDRSSNVLLYWLIGILFLIGIIAFATADRGGVGGDMGETGVGAGDAGLSGTYEAPARVITNSDQLPA